MSIETTSARNRTDKKCTRAEFAAIARRDGWSEKIIDLIIKTSTPKLPAIGVAGWWCKITDWPEIAPGKYC